MREAVSARTEAMQKLISALPPIPDSGVPVPCVPRGLIVNLPPRPDAVQVEWHVEMSYFGRLK
jgi:hypothetical protein